MDNLIVYSGILLFSVFISSVSQIVLKKAATRNYSNRLKEYLNPMIIIAYIVFFLSTLITVFALKYVPLSLAPILESTSYIFVAVLGYIFLKEKLSKRKLIGMGIIVLGILIFSI